MSVTGQYTLPIPAETLEMCGAVRKLPSHPSSFREGLSRYSTPSDVRVANHAIEQLEAAFKADTEMHARNEPKIAKNRIIRDIVGEMMKAIGVTSTRNVRKPGRTSAFGKLQKIDAGYLADLAHHVPVSDGFNDSMLGYNALKARYEEFAKTANEATTRAATEKAEQAERERAKRKADLGLAAIILRYGLDQEADWTWDAILEELRKRDQRLDLAVAMLETRGDWSEGFYRVSDAVSRFTIRDDKDKEIINDILGCMQDDDGRVFRDTKWSYSALFADAEDHQLVADIRMALDNRSPR